MCYSLLVTRLQITIIYCREEEDTAVAVPVTFLHVISRWFFNRCTCMCRAYAFWWVCKWARKSCNSWLEYHNSWWLIVLLLVVVCISRTRLSVSKDTCLCSWRIALSSLFELLAVRSVSLLLLLFLLRILLSVIVGIVVLFVWFVCYSFEFYVNEQQHVDAIKGSRVFGGRLHLDAMISVHF